MDITFPFPFKPYDIQIKFMKELYLTLENKQLGIFESPTGTGKSLSICCSALQWLRDSNKKQLEELEKEVAQLKDEISSSTDCINWLQEEYEKIQKNQTLAMLQLKLDKIKKRKELYEQMRVRVSKQKSSLANKNTQFYFQKKSKNVDLDSDKENMTHETDSDPSLSVSWMDRDLILEELDEKDEEDDNDDAEETIDDDKDDSVKIYISSRTHSQLSQFIGEIKRTVFKEDTRVVTLASRQHYCINSEVAKLKNVNLINERCLDLQKSKTKSTSVGEEGKVLKKTKTRSCTACPYYNQSNINKLKERLLVDILDMEDLVKCGKELKACPYYASRMAVDDAEVVLVSHAGIVSSGARSGMALKLHNNVVILDEAHALAAGLQAAHSAPVCRTQLRAVLTCLHFYIDKYRARLSSKNLLSLNQISFVVGKLLAMITPKSTDKKQEETKIFTLEDFAIKAEIDHINLRPLVEFCRNTRLAPKLHGFSMRYSQRALEDEMKKSTVNKKSSFEMFMSNITKKKIDKVDDVQIEEKPVAVAPVNPPTETSVGSALYAALALLDLLCARAALGRVLSHTHAQGGQLKYLLLNPAEHFSQLVAQCRSVIVAGGTMEPISEFSALLSGPRRAVRVVRCEHVVPPGNVLALCLSRGPTNVALNYSYDNRMSNALLSETGRILRNICSVVPGGVVCFLPSYSYEQAVYEHLKNNNIIEAISKKKTIFREPKSASDVDQVLNKYAAAIKSGDRTGALMLSVVGGKLSEGLNFSDELGRCVVVVGLPYPNVKSPELQENINYLNKTYGGGAGSVYYENLCMKAVNQCIGRAVRHADDYASVVLVDERYSRTHTAAALPPFVQKSLISNCNFGMSISNIAKFFNKHKEKKTQ